MMWKTTYIFRMADQESDYQRTNTNLRSRITVVLKRGHIFPKSLTFLNINVPLVLIRRLTKYVAKNIENHGNLQINNQAKVLHTVNGRISPSLAPIRYRHMRLLAQIKNIRDIFRIRHSRVRLILCNNVCYNEFWNLSYSEFYLRETHRAWHESKNCLQKLLFYKHG